MVTKSIKALINNAKMSRILYLNGFDNSDRRIFLDKIEYTFIDISQSELVKEALIEKILFEAN